MLKPTTPFLFSFSLAQILHVHKYNHQFKKIHKLKKKKKKKKITGVPCCTLR
jgi:hypothetical protein